MNKLILARYLGAIGLHIFMLNFILAGFVRAEQIDRSRSKIENSPPSVTDLNLSIPVQQAESNSVPRIQARSKPIDFNSTHSSGAASATTEQFTQVKSMRRRSSIANQLNSAEKLTPDRSIRPRNSIATNFTPSTSTVTKDRDRTKLKSRLRISTRSQPPLNGNYLRLARDSSKGTNDRGNPIYTLEVYIGGVITHSYNAVSGIASSQNLDRHIGKNHAPLPDGLYHVSDRIVPGAVPEVGKTFIGIYPQFVTGRKDLGIHVDPSFNLNNGRDGTSGCIGLTNSVDRDAINQFIIEYHPRNLFVSIANRTE